MTASVKVPFISFACDADDNLWIGTTNGAYYIKNGELIHFTANNGLADIYNDADNIRLFKSRYKTTPLKYRASL